MKTFVNSVILIIIINISIYEITFCQTRNYYLNNGSESLIEKSNKIPTYYDRVSLSLFFVDFNESSFSPAKKIINNYTFSGKFDNNNFWSNFYKPSFRRSYNPENHHIYLLNELNKNNFGKDLLSKLFNRKPDGTMNLELIHSRGRFTTNDQDYLISQSLKRGEALLKDYGLRLLNLGYLLLIDIQNLKPIYCQYENNKIIAWEADAVGYLYKLDFNETLLNKIFKYCWIGDEDNPKTKNEKNKYFESLNIPISFVAKFPLKELQDKKLLSEDKSLNTIIDISVREMINKAEILIGDFKVKVPVYSVKPICAKIGKKEGLQVDDRFFAYEFYFDKKVGEVSEKFRGVVRASSKISNNFHNATGSMNTSKFYQVSGKSIKPGYILVQNNDIGLELSFLQGFGNVGVFSFRNDVRLSQDTKIKSFFIIVEFNFQIKKQYEAASSILAYNNDKFSFFQIGSGIAKGFQILRNIELRPYTTYGWEYAFNKEIPANYNIGAFYLRPGINLSINLNYKTQLIFGASYSFMYGWITDEEKNSIAKWDDIFYGRKGLTNNVGIKFSL